MKKLLFVLFCAVTLMARAQTTAFTYQGKLSVDGAAANGVFDIQFKLFATNVNGSAVGGSLTNSNVAVNGGLFTTTLDFGATPFTGTDYWLEIGVRTNGNVGSFTTLLPRQAITPSPYAINAKTAATASLSTTALTATTAINVTGMISDSQLSSNVARLNGTQSFSNNVVFSNAVGNFSGNGAGLTNIQISALAGGLLSQKEVYFSRTDYGTPGVLGFSLGDLNGDGKGDLVFSAQGSGSVIAYTNDGSGSFAYSSSGYTYLNPLYPVIADMNGDGANDIVVVGLGSSTLDLLTNNGAATFNFGPFLNTTIYPRFALPLDVNLDGKMDLLVPFSYSNSVVVFTNDGSGVLTSNATITTGYRPLSMASADFNGDGKPDFVTANLGTNTLTLVTNNGVGGFAVKATLTAANFPSSVIAVDVNGDGKPDILAANSLTNTLSLFLNNGGGNFGAPLTLIVGNNPASVAAADVTGDGKIDLISADFDDNTLTVLANNGAGMFSLAGKVTGFSGPTNLISMDLDGDGIQELVCDNAYGSRISVLKSGHPIVAAGPMLLTNSANIFAGDGAGITNINLATIDSTLATNDSVIIKGNKTGNFTSAVMAVENDNTTSSASPALRVLALGTPPDGALSVSANNTNGPIAKFGNVNSFVTTIQNDGTIASTGFSGSGASLTSLNASQLASGTVPAARIPAFTGDVTNSAGSTVLSLATNGVVAGTYAAATVTVDAKGRVTSASSGVPSQWTTSGTNMYYSTGNVAIGTNNPGISPLFVRGSHSNGWANSLAWIDNVDPGTNAAPALRVIAGTPSGRTPDGALSVSANVPSTGTNSIIAEFGNSSAYVVIITNNGTIFATGFTQSSDRNAKENFKPIDARMVLQKVAALPISEWNFKTETGVQHIGPMAQDFYKAFGTGLDDRHIATVDEGGVALAAIQGLNKKVDEKEAEIKALKEKAAQVDALTRRVEQLEKLLQREVNTKDQIPNTR